MVNSPRMLFVTADMGAGHRRVTAELVRRCEGRGAVCEVVDIVRDGGRAGRRLVRTYRRLLALAPWVYDAAMRLWAHWPAPLERFTALNAGPFERLLRAAVDGFAPDLVISDYNLASQCLGRLVRRGEVMVPVATLVVDAGAHPYWVSRDVSAHLVPTALTGQRLAAMGARGVQVVVPVLRPEFDDPPERGAARRKLELPLQGRIVLLTAGSWAVGGLSRAVAAVRDGGNALVVVLCGRDEKLRHRLRNMDGVLAVGWTSEVIDYLCAADVVVDNAGGLTCWEALACGTPVVSFRPLAGHGRVNVATLAELGLARWAHDRTELAHLLDRPAELPAALPGGAAADDVVLALAGTGC